MNPQTVLKIKLLLVSLAAGVAITLALFALGETGTLANVAQPLLSPGLLLAGIAGYGAHDIEAILLAFLVDSLLYGVLSMFILSVVRPSWLVDAVHKEPASGPKNTATMR